ncbi:DMT family transporter [Clostridium sp. AN503]|uniref:DMT family transporter n=1 Tax=Clostridium sp. AN503 TaxID=3160598 RepID=UPI00345A5851
MKKYLAITGLILVTIIWGSGFVASDMALDGLLPFQIMTVRFFLAAVLIGAVSLPGIKKVTREELRAGFLMGCALFAGFALQIIALQYTTPSKNAFLTATNVVMVPFIAFVIHRKKVGIKGIIGAVMAIVGVGVLSLERDFSLGAGDALTLVCAVGFAFQIFLTGEFAPKYRASALNMVQMCTAFILSLICLFLFGEFHFEASSKAWMSAVYLGVFSTTLAYLLQTSSQKYIDETKAAIILSMESVFGTLFSVLLLHEAVTGRMMAGCVIILAAVIISNASAEAGGTCGEGNCAGGEETG